MLTQGRTRSSSPPPPHPVRLVGQEQGGAAAAESRRRGERLRDPRCTGRTSPGHSVPAAAIVRSRHQSRGRCCKGWGAAARWEDAELRLPGEGRRPGQTPLPHGPHVAQAPVFLRAGWGLELSGPRKPSSPGWMLPSTDAPLPCSASGGPSRDQRPNSPPAARGCALRGAGGDSPAGKAF